MKAFAAIVGKFRLKLALLRRLLLTERHLQGAGYRFKTFQKEVNAMPERNRLIRLPTWWTNTQKLIGTAWKARKK